MPENLTPEQLAAVQNSMRRRQEGRPTPALGQQGPGSATPTPQVPSVNTGTPSGLPSTVQPQGGTQELQGGGLQGEFPNAEAALILKAMDSRLKAISKREAGGLG